MSVEFSLFEPQRAVLITIKGDVEGDEIAQMRQRSVELLDETGYKNFIVDLRELDSIERGSAFAVYDLGEKFSDYHFSVWTNTAVLLPEAEAVREHIEFLHTVEVNRGRGVLNYVESFDEAFSWFEEMESRL